ncbi:MAG: hypothetical protein QN141_09435 [Armatimonadota bacterium]|nr:hypothetical protein [Armatimonadota bacterium]MDR7451737.1 hypothetical protein [Armatimonadota bacterium]MDR7467362.1 hypothetical protein [Armatimonadota bacterium]MDR7494132.1 hypothetical protein [Armatimonadota bacterium]MDR7498902.1 hypothetical protein [Armatimonadota bacterium]
MAGAVTGPQNATSSPLIDVRDRLTAGAIWVFALIAVALFRLVDATLDLRVFGYDHLGVLVRTGRPVLIVVWHGKGLLPVFFLQGLPLVIYSSQTRQGRIPALSRYVRQLTLASLQHLGYQVLDAAKFGSESRGVIRLLQYLERGRGGMIAADGPGGPVFRAKPGAAYVAKKTGVALVPVGAAIRDPVALDSWDRFEIPRAFTKAVITIGEPLEVPEDADEAELEGFSRRLEDVLNDLTTQAEVEAYARPAPAAAPAGSR